MKKQKSILLIATLVLVATAGGMLYWLKTHQRLGTPGIKTAPTSHPVVMEIDLPAKVLDFMSTERLIQSAVVTNFLPKDTSFALRVYNTNEGIGAIQASVILMGKDRTSIHKPEYCLPGQGFRIEAQTNIVIPIAGPQPYALNVKKWNLSITIKDDNGQPHNMRAVYMFWFVADNQLTTDHRQRMWWLARDLLRHGVLQRWAYISYFAGCQPGEEEATAARMEKLIAASVPEFQIPPRSGSPHAVARR
jgi:hypothetical protein